MFTTERQKGLAAETATERLSEIFGLPFNGSVSDYGTEPNYLMAMFKAWSILNEGRFCVSHREFYFPIKENTCSDEDVARLSKNKKEFDEFVEFVESRNAAVIAATEWLQSYNWTKGAALFKPLLERYGDDPYQTLKLRVLDLFINQGIDTLGISIKESFETYENEEAPFLSGAVNVKTAPQSISKLKTYLDY